jgi:hypothetical protein
MTTVLHDFTTGSEVTSIIEDDLLPGMTLTIGVVLTACRALGKPDPTDDDLYRRLSEAGFTAVDILRWFQAAKAAAMGGQHDQL